MSENTSSITIKKYANRRLYNTATSSYVTLENLGVMVKEGTEFNVYDAKTGEDLTRSVLTQIIVEEEGKSGQNLLPVGFLRQLISFYGDSMQWMVPKYLEQSMQTLTTNQDQLRSYFQNTLGNLFPFGTTLEEMSKQNMAMFERAMTMFSPFSGNKAGMPIPGLNIPGLNLPGLTIPGLTAPATTGTTTTTPTSTTSTPSATTTTAKPTDAPTSLSEYRATAAKVAETTETADEMQQKISNLQKQLADLAKKR